MSRPAQGYVIRRATPGDHAAVARELGAYLDHIGVSLDPHALDHDIAQWRTEYDGVCGVLLLVVDPSGDVVGTAGVRLIEPGVGEIKRMWIRPARQGLGLGRSLMDACLEAARALGCGVLRLDSQRRLEAALHLYRAYGFEEIADYNGNPRAEIWMEATLSPGGRTMPTTTVTELRKKSDATWANLGRQLQGMEPHMERADAPGEWTTRQVLCHLLFEPGRSPVSMLKTFGTTDLPLIEIKPGETHVTPERQQMTLRQLQDALDAQRREVFAYLDGLSDTDLGHKARIPLFKPIMGKEEIPIPVYVGAMFDYHWGDHAGQLAKIRKAVGLPEAK